MAVRPALEHVEDTLRNEPAAQCQNVAIAISMLMAAEQAHRLHQVQMLPGARHRHVKETPFFLDLLTGPTAMSEGMQPSVTLSTNTASHSCPFAEWIVDSTR